MMEMHKSEVLDALNRVFSNALTSVMGRNDHGFDPNIRESKHSYFGDFQAECCMSIGNQIDKNPRELARKIISTLGPIDFVEGLQVSGPGFIDIYLKSGVMVDHIIDTIVNKCSSKAGMLKRYSFFRTPLLEWDMKEEDVGSWVKFTHSESMIKNLEKENSQLEQANKNLMWRIEEFLEEKDKSDKFKDTVSAFISSIKDDIG